MNTLTHKRCTVEPPRDEIRAPPSTGNPFVSIQIEIS